MSKNTPQLPEWELVLSAAARLQELLPDAVLVGGTSSSIYADHVLVDLREQFDAILAQMESVAGWKTARIKRPVQILGSLDGIETGIRQLIREEPLETAVIECRGHRITLPSEAEMLRIKGVLILKRNATRDYLDFVSLADRIGDEMVARALRPFDSFYGQENEDSPLQQLQVQLAKPLPFDLEATELREYKNLSPRWHDWSAVEAVCVHIATDVFDRVCELESGCASKLRS